jgi:hypothetical protein
LLPYAAQGRAEATTSARPWLTLRVSADRDRSDRTIIITDIGIVIT